MQSNAKLIKQHEGIVYRWALRYAPNYNISIEDLAQEGRLGIIQARKCYDKSKKVKFITYAVYWIKASMQKFIRDNCFWRRMRIQNMSLDSSYCAKSNRLKDYHKDIHEYLDISAYQKHSDFVKVLQDKSEVEKILSRLRPNERSVVELYFGLKTGTPISVAEVAKQWGSTRQWAGYVFHRAIKKIKKSVVI